MMFSLLWRKNSTITSPDINFGECWNKKQIDNKKHFCERSLICSVHYIRKELKNCLLILRNESWSHVTTIESETFWPNEKKWLFSANWNFAAAADGKQQSCFKILKMKFHLAMKNI